MAAQASSSTRSCHVAIERRIPDEANVAILGVDLAESGHSQGDGDSVGGILRLWR